MATTKTPLFDTAARKWLAGLIAAVLAAIIGYLTQGCTAAQLSQTQQAAVAASTLCAYLDMRTEPEFSKAKEACAKKAELQAIMRAAAECEK